MSSGSDKRQRTEILRVRLSPAELEALEARAQGVNRTVAAFVREVALGQSVRVKDTSATIAALSRVGNNLNQLAKRAHQTGHVPAAEALAPLLDEVRAAIEGLAG
ncbi:plasmid mobilization protein [Azospirillum sp. sgz302134]